MKNSFSLDRRRFLGFAATAGAFGLSGYAGAPSIVSSRSPNGRLRFAAIGCGGEGRYDISVFAKHRRLELAAFCDVDQLMLDRLRAKYPQARYYQEWRKMLDEVRPDAVLVATPDHNHTIIMNEVMRRGINLYAQKPLCRTLDELALLRRTAKESGVVTQLGTQGVEWECDRYTTLMLKAGRIGEVKKLWLFTNTGVYQKLYTRKWPLVSAPVPKTLDWKGWLEGAPYRDYVPGAYHSFVWRAWKDFGSGWLGDMGCHLFSPVLSGLDMCGSVPVSVTADVHDEGWDTEMRGQFLPMTSHLVYRFDGVKATGMKPIEMEWCDGPIDAKLSASVVPDGEFEKLSGKKLGQVPERFLPPAKFREMAKKTPLWRLPLQGRVIEGSEGWIISSLDNEPPVVVDKNGKALPISLPTSEEPVSNHYFDFVDCCLDGGTPRSSLDWTTNLTEIIVRGTAAIRSSKVA